MDDFLFLCILSGGTVKKNVNTSSVPLAFITSLIFMAI